MDYEDKKPSVNQLSQEPSQSAQEQQNPEHINLKVEFPEGEFTNFKIKRVTKMEKLMKAFYAQKGLQPGSVRLLLDDRRIHPNDTAETLNAMDGDVINVYSEQAGGKELDLDHTVKGAYSEKHGGQEFTGRFGEFPRNFGKFDGEESELQLNKNN